jgi:NAD dependent epimerase/dehydratase family
MSKCYVQQNTLLLLTVQDVFGTLSDFYPLSRLASSDLTPPCPSYFSFQDHHFSIFRFLHWDFKTTATMPQRILLTGANGFIGSHVLALLLLQGHSVRAIIRSQSKASQVLSDFPNYVTKLDFGIVPDITSPSAFDNIVKSDPPFDAVIHTASPFLCMPQHSLFFQK